MCHPILTTGARHNALLQSTVKPFHHPIGLGMVRRRPERLDAQEAMQFLPEVTAELPALVSSDITGNAKS